MANKYQELQAEHQRLLGLQSAGTDPEKLLPEVQAYIESVKQGAQHVAQMRDRSQLRANLRFWAAYVFEHSGTYPDTTLLPSLYPAREEPQPEPPGLRAIMPAWLWVVGALILVGLVVGVPALFRAMNPETVVSTAIVTEVVVVTEVKTEIVEVIIETETPSAGTPASTDTALTTPQASATPQPTATASATPAPVLITAAAQVTSDSQAMTTRIAATTTAKPASTPVSQDPDDDGLDTRDERRLGTDPKNPDTDGDGALDGVEVYVLGTDPLVPNQDSVVLLPVTSGGPAEEFIDRLYLSSKTTSSAGTAGCRARQVTVSLEDAAALSTAGMKPAAVTLSLAGSGERVAQGSLGLDAPLTLSLSPTPTSVTYLLQVDSPHAQVVFDTVILQFAGDCSQNETSVSYQPNVTDSGSIAGLLDAAAPQTGLNLTWHLLTWGPTPFTGEWVAELRLSASGGDGVYLYWAQGDTANSSELLAGDVVVARQKGCTPAEFNVGVTSGGLAAARELVFHSPVCPETVTFSTTAQIITTLQPTPP